MFDVTEVNCNVTPADMLSYQEPIWPEAKVYRPRIVLPKKLETTMGIELTYLPIVFDKLWDKMGINLVSNFNNEIKSACLRKMSAYIDKNKIETWDVGTDVGCVEVPTKPYDDSAKLMNAVKQISAAAKHAALSPIVKYSVSGGGAHIHTGIPFRDRNDDESKQVVIYCKLMQIFAADNPWLAWAFAGHTDYKNAQALARTDLKRGVWGEEQDPLKVWRTNRAEAWTEIHRYTNDMRALQKRLAMFEKDLHAIKPHDVYSERELRNLIARHQGKVCSYRKAIAASRKVLAQPKPVVPKVKQTSYVKLSDVSLCSSKQYVVVARSHTMEWRAFRMMRNPAQQAKHIALLNAIVRKIKRDTEAMPESVPEFGYTEEQLRKMKYSERAVGFNRMLDSFGLDRDLFRAERVNMALRMRYMRKHGRH